MFDNNQHDETTGQEWANQPGGQAEPAPETVGFCQDCGRPLTLETRRTVGTGVFCEPCLQVRLNTGVPPIPPIPPVPLPNTGGSIPNPTVAGLLGFIPGVGAMYNGQFAKGIAHLAIFTILMSLSDNVKIFGLMGFGWYVYQIFDAVYTARARRDGLPLPNPFGLNDIGERIAHGRWNTTTPGQTPPPPPADPAATGWQPVTPPPPSAQANWAGYVPPTAFGGPAAPYAVPQPTPEHVETFTGTPVPPPNYWPPVPPPQTNRFPTAAIVLIALGALFLLANVIPSFHLNGDWTTAFVLAAAAVWSLYRRLGMAQQLRATTGITGGSYVISVYRPALVLAVLALLFVLQALHIATLGQTWPLMPITAGVLIFIDRAASHAAPPPAWPVSYPPPPPAPSTSIVPTNPAPLASDPAAETEPTR